MKGKNKNYSIGKRKSGLLDKNYLSTIVKKIVIIGKYITVISVSSHNADLEPPTEKAAVKNKLLVSTAGALHSNAAQSN